MKRILSSLKSQIKFLIPILIFLTIITLIGILSFRVWDPFWNPFRPSPARVLGKMVLEMEKVETSEGRMDFYFSQSNQDQIELIYTLEGKEDLNQKENQKTQSTFKVRYSLKEGESQYNLEYRGEKIVIGKTTYLKFTQLPEIQFFDYLSSFKDQWIKIDQSSLMESFKKIGGEKMTPEKEKIYKEQIEKLENQEEFQTILGKILMKEGIFEIKKKLPDEKINQKEVYHYLVSLSSEKILKKLSEMPKGSIPESETSLEDLKSFFEKAGDIEGEIWVGKRDFLLYKIKAEKNFDLTKFGKEGGAKIKLSIENFNYNLPVEINPPPESKTIEEVFTPFLEKYGEKLRALEEKTKDTQIIVQIIQLKAIAELMKTYENSFEGLCKNGTLNEEKKNYKLGEIEETIKNLQGGILQFSCYSAKESFCFCVDLVSSNKGKYCLDSSGIAKEIDKNSDCLGKGTKENPYRCP